MGPRAGDEVWYLREATSLAVAVVLQRARELQERIQGRKGAMNGLGRDLRQALRLLTREPGTTLAIALTLAVAVGATTTIAAVADAAFLRRLPYPHAERLVRVYSGSREDPEATTSLSPLDLRDLRSYPTVVEAVGAWTRGETVHLATGVEPRRLDAPRASAELFRILGLEPELGRFFGPEEEAPGRDDAVVLSHALWVDAFGADSALVGRSITLDGAAYRVVGVAPPEGALPRDADLWRPLALGPEWYDPERWGWQFLAAVARLRPGLETADASELLTARLALAVPERVERGQTRVVRTLYDERVGASGRGVLLLLAAVGLLLAMACANVMNVALARAERRVGDYGLRRALGCGPGPLIRLVAFETVGLSVLGGLGGAAIAWAGLRALARADLAGLTYLGSLQMDPRVAAFTLALTVVTAAAFGLAPVRRALRTDPRTVLRAAGAGADASRAARRTRNALVVTQVALAYTLLVAMGLSASAFLGLLERDPGFRADSVLTASIELPADAYQGGAGASFYRSLLDRIRGMPGVTRAGAVYVLPLDGLGWSASIELIDPDPAVTDPDPGGNMRPVSPGYFETLEIPLLDGRTFTDADDLRASPVVVVDEILADRYWPGGSAVGSRVQVSTLSRAPATVVGVVGSVPDQSLASPGAGHVYFPLFQRPMRAMVLVARTSGDPVGLAPALRGAVREADPRIPVTELSTLESRIRHSLAAPEAGLLLLGLFGLVATLLAAVGIYGVLSHAISRRAPEIGTRMALGATRRSVLGSVVGQAVRLWIVGALLGTAGALSAAGVLDRLVPGVRTADPIPWALALLGLGGVAVIAAALPAIRATWIDPAHVLKAE
jgi:predicted permease